MLLKQVKRLANQIPLYLGLIVAMLWVLFPIYWIVRASLMPRGLSFVLPPKFMFMPTLSNYAEVLTQGEFPRYFLNSLIVAITSTALSVLVSLPAAYALVRIQFPGRNNIRFVILSARMALPVAALVAYFRQFIAIGLMDTRLGLIIAYLSFLVPLATWLLMGFIQQIPVEIEEAAQVDGLNHFGVLRLITLPLIAPGAAVTSILCMLSALNEFLFAAVLTSDKAKTATVAVYGFLGQSRLDWEYMTATSVLVSLPVLIMAVAVRRYLVSGLTFGAVKS